MTDVLDVMVDLETMDTKVTAAITAIGAVWFNKETGEIGKTFYRKVDLQSCIEDGFTVSGDTINWWLVQNNVRKCVYSDLKSIQ